MKRVVAIVEGDGEVAAVPILLRRLGEWLTPETGVQVVTPIRIRRDQFLNRDDEFRRHLLLAAAKCGRDGWILILLDADDDCPADLGAATSRRAAALTERPVSVVIANREYEAWFIAAARSLHGQRRFMLGEHAHMDAETPRNAKGWIEARMSDQAYRPTTDQPALTARMDLQQAFDGSRSFRKLCSEWHKRITEH